ncbi:helix-turn-helix domain-containing protein [Streptomyces sp. NPDC059378]|uniref:helix-turn-helix domain-containing protein n=1 Tax=Streptomyces sp. NPDC059378 TaxID=3346815 RepID=UPI0036A1429D
MGVTERTVRRWARAFREFGEAGLVPKTALSDGSAGQRRPALGRGRGGGAEGVRAGVAALGEGGTGRGRGPRQIHVQAGEGAGDAADDGLSVDAGAGTALSDVPAEYPAQPGHRRPSEEGLRQAAAHAAGRVRADGHHPAGCVRPRPGDAAVDAGGADRRDGLVHPLHHRSAADTGVDQGDRCRGRALPGIPSRAGSGELGEGGGLT